MAKKLSAYHAKRDFSKTTEPTGAERTVASKAARFVIQKHAATRLHYDLRLELDGVFKSWAVTRGPSLDPKDKRLAVEVEDHPLDYGDFEGTIPAGEYGGGTVQIWDRGYWLSQHPHKELEKGDLKFALAGEKLRGSWAFVRMKSDRTGSKRNNWLLIKHRDEFAVDGNGDAVLEDDRSVASGRKMEAIASGRGKSPAPFMTKKGPTADAIWHSNDAGSKDEAKPPRKAAARAGPPGRRSAKSRAAAPEPRKISRAVTSAKARKAFMPDLIEPQLCKPVEHPPAGAGWGHEVKLDGYRIIIRVEKGRVKLLTRKGLDWAERFPEIAKAMSILPDCMLDGEIAALDSKGRTDFAALQAALSEQKTGDLIFFAFDLLFQEDKDLRKLPLVERKQRLERLIGVHDSGILRYVEHLTSAGDEVLRSACRLELEGIVSKRLDAAYHSGRSDVWRKSKCRVGHEVVLGGWTSNNGADFRSLLAGVFRDGRLAYIGRIGTGFGQAKARQLLPKLKKAASKASPFAGPNAPNGGANIHWLKPDLVAEIEFAGWTGDGNIRQAAFKGLREDKPAQEIEAEVPAPAEDMPMVEPKPNTRTKIKAKAATAKRLAPRRRRVAVEDGDTTVMGVDISKPGKALWPADGDVAAVTKLDLARYFEAVGDWMMPHIIGRPCSVVRMPDGIGGESFFQRHAMKGMSDLLDVMDVSDERQPYIVVNRREGLAALAQIAALELHPWNCIPGNPDRPGRLVFDIDPGPDVDFDVVVATARELKERLSGLGLESLCKTTGGKGLHVVAPLIETARAATDWATAKDLAHALCLAMEADTPDLYVVNMAKSKREGRIFLDYLRNDRMATAVAPLSPRARPGAPVSMPLSWGRVRAGLDPHEFTIRTAPAILKKSKPWSDYDKARRSLADAIKKLKRKR
ncbi:DNA ligase D [Roseiarcaceae bacterium H3SJ34-1]|uniref:DNA ligase D n=1 Tax=Terripilifer ovatus TaxID=3032367 RepID=UPI003AB9AE5C|nr:DNA ligase D [Roseiarcaceae bacterium H3SJ34-1]